MGELNNILVEFDRCLSRYCAAMHQRLGRPLDSSVVANLLNKENINDDLLTEYYGWRNGIAYDLTKPTNAFQFCSFGVMPTLEFAYDTFVSYTEDGDWERAFFPIVASYGGEFLLFNHDRKDEEYGKIFLYSIPLLSISPPISYFDSLSAMLESFIQCYEKKAFEYDSDNFSFSVDIDKYFDIVSTLNPNSQYWHR